MSLYHVFPRTLQSLFQIDYVCFRLREIFNSLNIDRRLYKERVLLISSVFEVEMTEHFCT